MIGGYLLWLKLDTLDHAGCEKYGPHLRGRLSRLGARTAATGALSDHFDSGSASNSRTAAVMAVTPVWIEGLGRGAR